MNPTLHQYSAYGVAIASEWPLALPERRDRAAHLTAVEFADGTADDFADVTSDADESWFHCRLLPDCSTYLRWSKFYEFRVQADGSRILCRPLHETDRTVLQNFLFGQALSFALVHQGLEPLHAGVVRIEDTAIGLLGDCTFGKSTLVASFVRAGHRVVTDDLLMIARENGQTLACAGTGRIKLNPDSARVFLNDARAGEPLNPLTTKRSFPLRSDEQQPTPLPLTHLFVLPTPAERRQSTSIDIQPLSRPALFHELIKNTFNVEVFTRSRLERQFASAARLAADVGGFRARYPEGLEHLPEIRQHIAEYVRRANTISRRECQ